MTQIVAKLNHLRMSPRKVRLVADAIRGLDADEAETRLARMLKAAAGPVRTLLRSAIANAEHNGQLERSTLFVQSITVDKGPMLKRFTPRAFGRASDIHKHTSHLVITLGIHAKPKNTKRFALPAVTKKSAAAAPGLEDLARNKEKDHAKKVAKESAKPKAGKSLVDVGKRFFRRKSV